MAGASSTTARAVDGSTLHLLLATKLHVPRLRSRLIARPRLLARLDEAGDARLLLVSAPAGFGKTTLLADWIHRHDLRVTWLALDEQDNDPTLFWPLKGAGWPKRCSAGATTPCCPPRQRRNWSRCWASITRTTARRLGSSRPSRKSFTSRISMGQERPSPSIMIG